MSGQMPTCLLDKNVARKAISGTARAQLGVALNSHEIASVALLDAGLQERACLYISSELFHILQKRAVYPEVRLFMANVQVMRIGRYFKRWARRLGDFGFTYEDAKILAYGSFGTDETGGLLGVEFIATLDQPFINNYLKHREAIETQLAAMTENLTPPFCRAALPIVMQPQEFVTTLT